MQTTSIKQKLFLLIFGVFLAAILLEVGLRIAGSAVLYLQERHNHLSFNKNEYRILCLGESTTALGGEDSYPSLLEQMLNTQSRQKNFTVINKGIISTTSDYILTHVEQNLDQYKPQLVIVMMGINDRIYLNDLHKNLWWENIKSFLKDFRVYKLARLLCQHITHRIKEINAPTEEADLLTGSGNYQQMEDFFKLVITKNIEGLSKHMSALAQYQQKEQFAQVEQEKQMAGRSVIEAGLACVELAWRYRLQGSFEEAQRTLEQAATLIPKSSDIYKEWGELYLAEGKNEQALKAFQAAFVLDPKNTNALLGMARVYYREHKDEAFYVYAGYLQSNPQDYWGHIELAEWFREAKHFDLAQRYLSHAIKLRPDLDQAYIDWGQVLDDQGQYQQEETLYLKQIPLHPKNSLFFEALGHLYYKQGKADLAKGYFRKAAQRQMPEYCPATLINYSLLLDKILRRHIKVLVMQYPLREIGLLKDYLGQKKGIIFVENSQNFKQALMKQGYNYYFKDIFASDFGHCTRAGNELIARNLAEVILGGKK
ncbi:MAG: tetratricopeptide repeat protein [Candidatus Omnitrophica bacterium]|nr:tetratricopeptide repeat protein [Candidatus Omnitrophota bacterium]